MSTRRPRGFFKVMGFWMFINAFWIAVFWAMGRPVQQIGDVVTATGLGVAILAVVIASLILTHEWTFFNRALTAGMGATGALLILRGATLLWGAPWPWILWPVRVTGSALMFTALSALIAEVWDGGQPRRQRIRRRIAHRGFGGEVEPEPLAELKTSMREMRASLNPFAPALAPKERQPFHDPHR